MSTSNQRRGFFWGASLTPFAVFATWAAMSLTGWGNHPAPALTESLNRACTPVYVVVTVTRTPTRTPTRTRTPTPTTTTTPTASPTATQTAAMPTSGPVQPCVLWGAYYDVGQAGGIPPWNMAAQDTYEQEAGKRAGIIHWGQKWVNGDGSGAPFETALYQAVSARGSLPMVNWNPWRVGAASEPEWTLQSITRGDHDAAILQWASAAAAYSQTVIVRMMDEMNGRWYPWGTAPNTDGTPHNSNAPQDFVPAWRHTVDLFRQVGATNVQFAWTPNEVVTNDPPYNTTPLDALYPGDAYVDWVGMDAYNWGYNPAKGYNAWRTFSQVIGPTYAQLRAIAPTKPVMLGEWGTTEWDTARGPDPQAKAAWLTDALSVQIPRNFSAIGAVVYFNTTGAVADGMDWAIESSAASRSAYASGIQNSLYCTGATRP